MSIPVCLILPATNHAAFLRRKHHWNESHHQLQKSPPMTQPRSLICRSFLALAAMAAFTATARATNYSPLVGPKVTYTNINESNSQLVSGPPPATTSPAQLFGQPVLSPAGSDIL